jgi:hypothetical protein
MNTIAPSLRASTRLITVHADPGHAWYEAPRTEIDRLNLANKVSGYSYEHAGIVYLEEDCDAPLYLLALQAEGTKFRPCVQHVDHDSAIRCLPRFRSLT